MHIILRKFDLYRKGNMKKHCLILAQAALLSLLGTARAEETPTKPATPMTAQKNAAWKQTLDFNDKREFANATRGLIAGVSAGEKLSILRADGQAAWELAPRVFTGEAPDTANPSLWRDTQLNACAGLFQVCEGIYQVRGYDMANVTFIKTDHGYLVFDVLMCVENMKAALELAEKHLGKINVTAVLYSHPHIDHYGGVCGLISREQVADGNLPLAEQLKSGKIPVLAPAGFLQHAVSENVYAGIGMGRRAQYQYGKMLPLGPRERLAMGIGLGMSRGNVSLIAPTYEVKSDEKLVIDGLEIEFQQTPGTEAPAEMNAYFPKYKALWMAENCTGTLHNLYTLRGAQVRDARAWARYLLEAYERFSAKTEVIFQSHNWPHWKEEISDYLLNTAAIYQFIHDATLHQLNRGLTPAEIAAAVKLPEKLNRVWYTRQYYGTLSHNIKAVYQRYLGWYDANPVNLDPLPPEQTAKKLVEYLGDANAVLEKARADFAKGEYRWVAQITKELVFADPQNRAARELCADALEQLGYQAESGTWRNAYLTGALELRLGNQADKAPANKGQEGQLLELTSEMLLDYIGIMSDSAAAEKDDLTLYFEITDTKEKLLVTRRSGVLLYRAVTAAPAEKTDAAVKCARPQLLGLLLGGKTEGAEISGDATAIARLAKHMVKMQANFNVVEP